VFLYMFPFNICEPPIMYRDTQVTDWKLALLTTEYFGIMRGILLDLSKAEYYTFMKIDFEPESCSNVERINFKFFAFSIS
jgi:hypothetical protein